MKKILTPYYQRVSAQVKRFPFTSLFVLLGILVGCIAIASYLRKPVQNDQNKALQPKKVTIYTIGSAPKLLVQAQIEKSGVITISALAPGIIQYIGVENGSIVSKGQTIVSLASTYQGGNAPAIQASLAYQQLQNINNTYDTQKELISKQRDLANKVDENNDQLRDITAKSQDETRSAISLNDDIIANLDSQITAGTNVDVNKQIKSQYVAANNQLKSLLRSAEYSSPSDKPPADLSNLQKDITLKSLDIQEKALGLQKEIARLQYQLALVQQQSMNPGSPVRGVVQKVFVRVGQSVNPGTPLAIISQVSEEDPVTATAYISGDIARHISVAEPSILMIGQNQIEVYPAYISQDAVKGTLYAVYFSIPENYSNVLTDNGYINVRLPIGQAQTGSTFPFLPIDAVYQNETSSYIFVVQAKKAAIREVKLGQMFGSFIQIENGLRTGDRVILDRTVISGEPVIE